LILPSTWFENLFGFQESLSAVQENFIIEELPDHATLTSTANNRTFNVGRFSVRNLPSFSHVLEHRSATPGTLHIIRGEGWLGENSCICNVLETQSLPEFDGATFQAASNFNCLEYAAFGGIALLGVTNYVYDYTQGPYCALAAGAGPVYRNYFVPHADGTIGQLTKEIELLANTAIGRFVQHGFPVLGTVDLAAVAGADWDDLDQFRVGPHENLEVTTRTTRGSEDLVTEGIPRGQIVHQVYAAFLWFEELVERNETSLRIARQLLIAQYRATVLAAWEMSAKYPGRAGSRRLVLTAVGGGWFGNPRELIAGAVLAAEDLIRQSGLEVYFVCYDSKDFDKWLDAALRQAMENLGGRIVTRRDEI
jgi:hypothetical protein